MESCFDVTGPGWNKDKIRECIEFLVEGDEHWLNSLYLHSAIVSHAKHLTGAPNDIIETVLQEIRKERGK